ncbi:MAG: histidine-type phosphatase [Bacteroidales bacterium]|nr:histidine-type phosphatase [Bacteroidales bacterium]
MKKLFLFALLALACWACNPDNDPIALQTEWLERTDGFQDKYELEQLVVLSRHNIRTPLVGKGSVLSRVTDPEYQWFQWEDPASHLTAKGERLEEEMGTFFREWLSKKGFLDEYSANPSSFRFYANAKQRCQLTARTFADAVFPGADPEVEMKVEFDKMDPVFNPQITKLPDGFAEKAQQEIAARMGDLNAGIANQYSVIEKVIGITRAPAYPDTASFGQFPSSVGFKLNAEPFMNGGLKMACTVSDALVLQYYEEPDEKKAAFGHTLTPQDWINVGMVKDWYGDALFTAPSVAVNVAHPLLQTMLSELQDRDRVFSFLCGHDSNIGSVLAALETEEYDLPETIEKKTPIGSKVVIEKFKAKDGSEYADIWLVYASTNQLRRESSMTYVQPPVAVRLQLSGLSENADRLYRLSDVEQRFSEAIAAYDAL